MLAKDFFFILVRRLAFADLNVFGQKGFTESSYLKWSAILLRDRI